MDVRPASDAVVRAAGGVVWRPCAGGGREYVLVHRPAYDDWSFPKGKLARDEDERAGALREVLEETGMRCRVQRELGTTSYVDRRGRPKVVYYWLMRAVGGRFVPGVEVDEVAWLSEHEALRRLSYERDRTLLSALLQHLEDAPGDTSVGALAPA